MYFNKGQYNPETLEGKGLLAHELTHTIQQTGMVQKREKTTTSNSSELTNDQRIELRRITGNRIDKAYTDFIDAAGQVKKEIHDVTNSNIDFISC